MAQINVSNLTFGYEGSYDTIFENVSFSIDTSWKLGFVGRNGKGKTTFLQLLLGKYEYQGAITRSVVFDYFPYPVKQKDLERTAAELMEDWKAGVESWRVLCELEKLDMDAELLYRPFGTLSFGERTRVMLAVLFSGENDFLLIDEPTNHLDQDAREIIKKYLASKKGFILVSHDRDLLDACIDHVLVLNRASIEVQSGNFSSWWENKEKADNFARMEHEKHVKEIGKLKAAADRSSRWAEKNENTKIGYDPAKEHDRSISTRSYIGAKTKKMQSRVKAYEERMDREIEKKEGITGLNFELKQGDRVFLKGKNGCGKSSLIKYILTQNLQNSSNGGIEKRKITMSGCENLSGENIMATGTCSIASNLVISYINQDTSHLSGTLKEFAKKQEIDEPMLLSMLRSLDLDREQFVKNMEEFSEGQKKKVLIAASLLTPAYLYLWDEPLNYIDVFSRMQIEKLIAQFQPTMLIVEHDARFAKKLATKVVEL